MTKNREDSNVNTSQIQRNVFFELSITTAQDLVTDISPSFKLSFLGADRTGIKFQVVQVLCGGKKWQLPGPGYSSIPNLLPGMCEEV